MRSRTCRGVWAWRTAAPGDWMPTLGPAEEPHAGALAGPRRQQPLRQRRGPGVGLGVGEAVVAEDRERLVAPLAGRRPRQLTAGGGEGRKAGGPSLHRSQS